MDTLRRAMLAGGPQPDSISLLVARSKQSRPIKPTYWESTAKTPRSRPEEQSATNAGPQRPSLNPPSTVKRTSSTKQQEERDFINPTPAKEFRFPLPPTDSKTIMPPPPTPAPTRSRLAAQTPSTVTCRNTSYQRATGESLLTEDLRKPELVEPTTTAVIGRRAEAAFQGRGGAFVRHGQTPSLVSFELDYSLEKHIMAKP